MIKAAIMGHGTVGSGVYEVFEMNAEKIARVVGEPVEVKYVLDLRDFSSLPYGHKFVTDFSVIENDPEVTVVAEVMGGVGAAYEFTKRCLLAGKSVCTSNKELVATRGEELLKIAADKGVNYMFEASVGGGIPIIRPMLQCLAANEFDEICGILNGTTNYILTQMIHNGVTFADALRQAQLNGYAEKDPTADIEGYDACRKIAILTSLVCGKQVDYQDIPTEGISHITATDIRYANAMGRTIKLLADSKMSGDTYSVRVAPFLLTPDHPLYHVDDVFNAIFVHGNMLGDGMFYGSGAGKLPTASAVVADMVDMAKHIDKNIYLRWDKEKMILADPMEQRYRYFVRAEDGMDAVKAAFGDVEVVDTGVSGENGFVTGEMSEREYRQQAGKLSGVLQMIRMA